LRRRLADFPFNKLENKWYSSQNFLDEWAYITTETIVYTALCIAMLCIARFNATFRTWEKITDFPFNKMANNKYSSQYLLDE
ncbi:unnamed protein product, partial [Pocillopora meandrina]